MLALNLIVFGMSVRYADATPVHAAAACCLPSVAPCACSAVNMTGASMNVTVCSNSTLNGTALANNVTGASTALNFMAMPGAVFNPEFLQKLGYKGDQEAMPKDLSTLVAEMQETSRVIAFLAQRQAGQAAQASEIMGKPSGEASKIGEEIGEVNVAELYKPIYKNPLLNGGLPTPVSLTEANMVAAGLKVIVSDDDSTHTGGGSGDDAFSVTSSTGDPAVTL